MERKVKIKGVYILRPAVFKSKPVYKTVEMTFFEIGERLFATKPCQKRGYPKLGGRPVCTNEWLQHSQNMPEAAQPGLF